MLEDPVGEQTPLVDSTRSLYRQSSRRSRNAGHTAQSRAMDVLKRAQARISPEGGEAAVSHTGIDQVCRELEESERKNSRFLWLSLFFICNHIIGGAVAMYFSEGWSLYDCFYFCVVTVTTVGYGDITPVKTFSKLYVMYYVVASIALISAMLAHLVGLLFDRQEELLLSAIVKDRSEMNVESEQVEQTEVRDADMDMMESRRPLNVNERILDATKWLDLSDYYGLGFSLVYLMVILGIGFLVFFTMENLSVVDALYTTLVSATTIGFGDFEPTHDLTKLIITVWLIFSTIAVGKVVADFTDASMKVKQRDVSRRLLTASMDMESFKMLDKDKSGSVDKCEFMTELLVRSGKVDRRDVDTILLRFEQLDKDNSGEISFDDVS